MDPITIAILVSTLIQGGLGIWKGIKGSKMEKQSVNDRQMYINTMSDWAMHQLGQSEAARNYIEQGVPGASNMPTVGQISSGFNQTPIGNQMGVANYMNQISNIQAPANYNIPTWESKAQAQQKKVREARQLKEKMGTLRSSSRKSPRDKFRN